MLFVRDLPPVSTVDMQVTEPSIYFGELSNDYVIVRTRGAGVPLPEGRRQRLHRLRGHAAACGSTRSGSKLLFALRFRSLPDPAERRHHDREPADLRPADRRARREDRAVPASTTRIRILVVDDGRLFWIQDAYTDHRPLSVLDRATRRRQLHPQLGQGRDRRLQRHDDVLPRRPRRSDRRRRSAAIFPGLLRPLGEMPAGLRAARALSRRHLQPPGGDVLDLPHDQPGGLLQQGRSVGGAGHRRAAASRADGAVLHDDEAARRDAAPSSSRCCRSRRGGATTSPSWMVARSDGEHYGKLHGLPVPEAEAGLRPAAGRRAHQPGPGDLAADHAVEPAGLAR